MRRVCVTLLVSLSITAAASAQTADGRFRWQKGQVLHYRVEHATAVTEVVGGGKVETKSRVNLVKRWQVLDVDAQGTATVQMSISAMRNEQTRPGGDVLLFDSAAPDKSSPELREALSKFIGQPLAELRVDALGRVVEVKQSVAGRYESEPPFVVIFPAGQLSAGLAWQREFKTGETYPAVQECRCTKIEGGLATIAVATALLKQPESKAEMVPLLQKLPGGDVVFDVQRGRLHSARLVIDRQILEHQGEGSSYRFQSTYTEQVAE